MQVSHRLARQALLIDVLFTQLRQHDPNACRYETHISWVLVARGLAYKFKKSLRLPFLDFSTLAARHRCCLDELRLNRRFAPALYLDVVSVTGTPRQPCLQGSGAAIEYAVRMRAFPQASIWTHRIDHHTLTGAQIDALAGIVAGLHAGAARAPAASAFGSAEVIRRVADGNAREIAACAGTRSAAWLPGEIAAWLAHQHVLLGATFEQRKQQGYVRECHADLHCGNIVTLPEAVSVFDCLEFNENLRWIDVLDDLAFACMDLACRQRPDLAARLLNAYLSLTGDYHGLSVFRFYRVERALVRAKVGLLRQTQSGRDDGTGSAGAPPNWQRYLAYAREDAHAAAPALIIMHGCSGSGKTTLAKYLLVALGAVQLRSDVERKRLLNLPALARVGAAPGQGAYGAAAGRRVYAALLDHAAHVLDAQLPVIVDATFLLRCQRKRFAALAKARNLPFLVLNMPGDKATMLSRIGNRKRAGQDASDADSATLAYQLGTLQELGQDERADVVDISAGWNDSDAALHDSVALVHAALGRARAAGLAAAPSPCP